jgi:putative flippase GtrA
MNRTFLYTVFRFGVSGGLAAVVNFGALYIFTEFFHIWYLASSIISAALGTVVSFGMQKFWTFNNARMDSMHIQFSRYVLLTLVNLAVNTFLLYVLVEYAHLWYILAQFLTSGVLACVNFFVYRRYVFTHD